MHPCIDAIWRGGPDYGRAQSPTILTEKKPFWNVRTAKEAQLSITDPDIVGNPAVSGNPAVCSPAGYPIDRPPAQQRIVELGHFESGQAIRVGACPHATIELFDRAPGCDGQGGGLMNYFGPGEW